VTDRLLLDANIYIRASRDGAFRLELRDWHRTHLPQLVLSTVVAFELLIGARDARQEREIDRSLVLPMRTRRRLHTPTYATWHTAAQVARRLGGPLGERLATRGFFDDLLLAATARELGATLITDNLRDFAAIATVLDFRFAAPWPD